MKKLFIYSSIIIIISLVYTACNQESDKDLDTHPLVGTWETSVDDTFGDVTDQSAIDTAPLEEAISNYLGDAILGSMKMNIIFNDDNTGRTEMNMMNVSETLTSFTWSTDGDQITIDYGEDLITTNTYTIDGNILTTIIDDDELSFKKK